MVYPIKGESNHEPDPFGYTNIKVEPNKEHTLNINFKLFNENGEKFESVVCLGGKSEYRTDNEHYWS